MSLTRVSPDWNITISKTVRDDMGLFPYDRIAFSSDGDGYFLVRCTTDYSFRRREIAETATEYDNDSTVAVISPLAEIRLPESVIKGLELVPGTLLALLRDESVVRIVPLIRPSMVTPDGSSVKERTEEIEDRVEQAIVDYSVMVVREYRKDKSSSMASVVREGEADPFRDAPPYYDEPEMFRELFGASSGHTL